VAGEAAAVVAAGATAPYRIARTPPWVAPGAYKVRLTANGQTSTQPITVKMDPRVKDTPAVTQIYAFTTQAEDGAMAAEAAYKEARAAADKLHQKPASAAIDALIKDLDAIAPPAAAVAPGGGGGGGAAGGAAAPAPAPAAGAPAAAAPLTANLSTIGGEMVAAVMAIQGSEMPPTAAQVTACQQRQGEYTALMAKWTAIKVRLKAAGL
jgi:hypothetical protein